MSVYFPLGDSARTRANRSGRRQATAARWCSPTTRPGSVMLEAEEDPRAAHGRDPGDRPGGERHTRSGFSARSPVTVWISPRTSRTRMTLDSAGEGSHTSSGPSGASSIRLEDACFPAGLRSAGESLDYERVGGVINDGWRKAGVDVQLFGPAERPGASEHLRLGARVVSRRGRGPRQARQNRP